MKFKYSVASTNSGALTDSSGRIVKRPVLWLVLTGKSGEKINVPAVIDSGADTTTLNIQYADFLGIQLDWDKQKKYHGYWKGKCSGISKHFFF